MAILGSPYLVRVIVLLVFAAGVVAWDLRRRPGASTRLREYSFLLGCGVAAAVFGLVNDQITCTISPEYFVIGKGIAGGEGFRGRVAALGAEAGFSAGIIAGGVYLLANTARTREPFLALRKLVVSTWKPAAAAVLLGVAGGLLFPRVCPAAWTSDLVGVLTPPATASFVTVWGVHIGLYSGLAAGLVWGALGIRRRARSGLPGERSP